MPLEKVNLGQTRRTSIISFAYRTSAGTYINKTRANGEEDATIKYRNIIRGNHLMCLGLWGG